jgi:putative membrane protein
MTISDLPTVNASLNALCTVFLTAGYVFIRRGQKDAHRNCMVAAVITSAIFLTCYLTYHTLVKGVTRFQGPPGPRAIYLTILITHSFLAVVILPMVLITVRNAIKQRWEAHKRLARWTWPLWMYVSVTGVIVYLMLYHWYPPR